MKSEILVKIMRIMAKTGEKVIVVEESSGEPFMLMSLDEYEKIANKTEVLTEKQNTGIIYPDPVVPSGNPMNDLDVEEDRYYMEPTE